MIKLEGATYEKFNFPCGEAQVIVKPDSQYYNIEWEFERNEEIIEFLLIVDALKRIDGIYGGYLKLPYVPFSRQDRVNQKGEAFSLKVFCDLINSCDFEYVFIEDPHSDVTPALLKNCHIKTQHEIFSPLLKDRKNYTLVCPDAGAAKKISKFENVPIINCYKQRDLTGKITLEIPTLNHFDDCQMTFHKDQELIIIDDICDGGATFIEIAKQLRDFEAKKITLMVTHGFFTKGLGVFDGLIDEIYTRKGRVR